MPAGRVARGRLTVPPSKSLTNRYLNLALLAGAPAAIQRPRDAEDTRAFLAGLAACGFRVEREEDPGEWRLTPGALPAAAAIDCGASGTMLRFLTAALAALPGHWRLDGTPRLRERPVGPLVAALRRLGARVRHLGAEGYAPLAIEGGSLAGGEVVLDASTSSQFLSALLMAALRAHGTVAVEVAGLTSEPYLSLTLAAIRRFGGRVEEAVSLAGPASRNAFLVHPSPLAPGRLRVEGDFSAACYPAAAAALTGGEVVLAGLPRRSAQGDRGFFDLLEGMGAAVERGRGRVTVRGAPGGALAAVDADLSAMPDQVPTLAALAPFARGTTRIRHVAHLRLKESDRLRAMASQLVAAGAEAEETADGLTVVGSWAGKASVELPSAAVAVDPHGDHRIAMSMALVGLRRPGLAIGSPAVVAKSYPAFWRDLNALLIAGSGK
ncbi:MAG TPA: 3-phosphoshikimate 1-carboxyvinyltransferase [Thermoanaerobaculia bacterium]|nr:3-phosphoshikimate 1-carboxyvinyltransferase [Thermoanaerobaculia bacterium]